MSTATSSKTARRSLVGSLITALLLIVVGVLLGWYVFGRSQSLPSQSSVTGVVSSVTSQKICLQPNEGNEVCGALALQPGAQAPAQGETVTAAVYQVPVAGATNVSDTVTFLIITSALAPT